MKLPKANKELGQHFLIDQLVIDDITSNYMEDCSSILEIGPGPGILTQFLKSKNIDNKDFWVIEKDQRFLGLLKPYVETDNIFLADALRFNFSDLKLDNTWLVSNLPYNMSAPLTIKFLQNKKLNFMTLMYQKEVGEKIAPLSTKKNTMSSLFALTQTYYECTRLCLVPPQSFSPPPKVDSIVISFKRRQNPIIELQQFREFEVFLRKLFSLRRKQIKKVMLPFIEKEKLLNIFLQINKNGTERSETFSLNDVHQFYKLQRES